MHHKNKSTSDELNMDTDWQWVIDKQNVAYALKVFSVEVEDAPRSNGDREEAHYAQLLRGWYEAIDTPGIPALVRIKDMLRFRDYLLKDVDFGNFPPHGKYVKGMSVVQFCGFIQNIEIRMLLYALCKSGTYNHRAIGTLAIESFFCELTQMDPTGCPKSVKSPQMISHVTEINHYRHDAENRSFHMDTQRTSVYISNPLDGSESEMTRLGTDKLHIDERTLVIKDHFFDSKARAKSKRKRKSARISKPHETQKGTLPIRTMRYKKDESKISNLTKLGLNIDEH